MEAERGRGDDGVCGGKSPVDASQFRCHGGPLALMTLSFPSLFPFSPSPAPSPAQLLWKSSANQVRLRVIELGVGVGTFLINGRVSVACPMTGNA